MQLRLKTEVALYQELQISLVIKTIIRHQTLLKLQIATVDALINAPKALRAYLIVAMCTMQQAEARVKTVQSTQMVVPLIKS